MSGDEPPALYSRPGIWSSDPPPWQRGQAVLLDIRSEDGGYTGRGEVAAVTSLGLVVEASPDRHYWVPRRCWDAMLQRIESGKHRRTS